MNEFNDDYYEKLLKGQYITLYNTSPYTIADILHRNGFTFVSYQETRSINDNPVIIVTCENETHKIIAECDSIFGISKLERINKD